MSDSNAVDAYLAALPDDRRVWMQRLRDTIRAAAPGAVEVITYKMPGFTSNGSFLVSYDAYKRHYSLFPASAVVVDACGEALTPFLRGKGTISFPVGKPVPVQLATKIVQVRVAEIAARAPR